MGQVWTWERASSDAASGVLRNDLFGHPVLPSWTLDPQAGTERSSMSFESGSVASGPGSVLLAVEVSQLFVPQGDKLVVRVSGKRLASSALSTQQAKASLAASNWAGLLSGRFSRRGRITKERASVQRSLWTSESWDLASGALGLQSSLRVQPVKTLRKQGDDRCRG